MYIYTYYDKHNTPLYVGSTERVLSRFRQHQREAVWMIRVASITVRGPYPGKTALEYEKMYISHLQPEYNTNSLYYYEGDAFYDDTDFKCFNSVSEFVEFYTLKPDSYVRQTYYLRKEDIESLRILSFYMNQEKSALVRDALKIGLTQLGKRTGYDDIYAEARQFICNTTEA